MQHIRVMLFIGAPGVGKGTYSTHLTRYHNYFTISASDSLREQPLAPEFAAMMKQGRVLPGSVVHECVKNSIVVKSRMHPDKKLIVDGFPRNLEQALLLDKDRSEIEVRQVIHFTLPDSVIERKLLARRICSNRQVCKSSYNLCDIHEDGIVMPAILPTKRLGFCDDCGSPLVPRDDDNITVIRSRLKQFHRDTGLVVEFYREKGLLAEIDGTGSLADRMQALLNTIKTP